MYTVILASSPADQLNQSSPTSSLNKNSSAQQSKSSQDDLDQEQAHVTSDFRMG